MVEEPRLGLMLGGGGARAAYQAGVLHGLAKHFPDLHVPIVTGISAGAINAAFLANSELPYADATDGLVRLWSTIRTEDVLNVKTTPLIGNALRWGARLLAGGSSPLPSTRGMVDTTPLRAFLTQKFGAETNGRLSGIARRLGRGDLDAFAVTSTNYATGQAVTWVEANNPPSWERPFRRSQRCQMSVDHVMASASLPLFFPAVQLEGSWHGDGGIRLTAPLSPPLHLGASKVLLISTRRTPGGAPDRPRKRKKVSAASPNSWHAHEFDFP